MNGLFFSPSLVLSICPELAHIEREDGDLLATGFILRSLVGPGRTGQVGNGA